MNCKPFIYLSLILVLFTTCKKTQLKNDWSVLKGTWYWSRGWGDGGTKELKLELKKPGTYKLFRNKQKIEYGRLNFTNNYMKFISDKLFNNKELMLDDKQIVFMSNDSINVTRVECKDCAFSTFRKE